MSDSDTKGRDRPTDEPKLEITAAMIEAGVSELKLSFDADGNMYDCPDVVRDIFIAMKQASVEKS